MVCTKYMGAAPMANQGAASWLNSFFYLSSLLHFSCLLALARYRRGPAQKTKWVQENQSRQRRGRIKATPLLSLNPRVLFDIPPFLPPVTRATKHLWLNLKLTLHQNLILWTQPLPPIRVLRIMKSPIQREMSTKRTESPKPTSYPTQ